MRVSFEKPLEGAPLASTATASPVVDITPAASVPSSTALAYNPAPVQVVGTNPFFADDENISLDDIKLPRINIVQKVGDLSNIFNGGEIILDQELVIHAAADKGKDGDLPLLVTILAFRKLQFAEKVDGGAQGLLVQSEAAVAAAGGTLDYKEWEQSVAAVKAQVPGAKVVKLFQKLATALVLIECPVQLLKADADHISFPHECEGKYYAMALWSMKGSAFTNAAKTFFTARRIGHLKNKFDATGVRIGGGYPERSWTLTTKLESYKSGFFAYIPVVRAATASSPALKEFIQGFLQGL